MMRSTVVLSLLLGTQAFTSVPQVPSRTAVKVRGRENAWYRPTEQPSDAPNLTNDFESLVIPFF